MLHETYAVWFLDLDIVVDGFLVGVARGSRRYHLADAFTRQSGHSSRLQRRSGRSGRRRHRACLRPRSEAAPGRVERAYRFSR